MINGCIDSACVALLNTRVLIDSFESTLACKTIPVFAIRLHVSVSVSSVCLHFDISSTALYSTAQQQSHRFKLLNMETNRLITLPLSHYCERARWALDHAGIEFVEEGHVPMYNRLFTGGGSTPYFIAADGSTMDDSRLIMERAFGTEMQDSELESRFNKLGKATRVIAYCEILPNHSSLACSLLAPSDRVPYLEALSLNWGWFYPLRILMQRALGLTAENAARSLVFVEETFEYVEQILADGRPFLEGQEFGMMDISFASLASPLVCPPENQLYLHLYESLDDESPLKQLVDKLRSTRAGIFCLEMYANHRKR